MLFCEILLFLVTHHYAFSTFQKYQMYFLYIFYLYDFQLHKPETYGWVCMDSNHGPLHYQ